MVCLRFSGDPELPGTEHIQMLPVSLRKAVGLGGKGTLNPPDTVPLPLLVNYVQPLSPVAERFLLPGKTVGLQGEPGPVCSARGCC